ncbi:phosphoglycolate phosphatase [Serratia microhaemolytica]|uniref:phosphoglycolate phosphatase n=1 Tax=Serratia microhaemolytica TaxID=2675110 RepID=UPI000FDD8E53|nr:phosphoglycolate phosphatase [Serratia microhaemolytica]
MADLRAIRALAFDLDGTLVDSVPGLAAAIDLALRESGLAAAGKTQVACWIGNGADLLVQRALEWAGGDISAANCLLVRQRFDHFYRETVQGGSNLFPGVKESLTELAQRGYPLALVTNKPTPFIAPLLASLGIDNLFSPIIGGDDVVEKKPHPAPLYLVCGKLGLHTNQLLFVGDSRNDILAAQAAGCPSVGLTYGYNYGESIALSHPDYVLTNFADLLSLVDPSCCDDQEI